MIRASLRFLGTLAVLYCLVLAAPAQAQKRCERAPSACPGGQNSVVESRQLGLVLAVPAAQQAYYRQLIPVGYKAPDLASHYQVAVYLEETHVPLALPLLGALNRSYQGFVAIRVRRDDAPEAGRAYEPLGRDEEGFFPIIMPVSNSQQLNHLRANGLPAILVSGSSVDGQGTQQIAVQYNKLPLLSLQWSADDSAAAESSDDTKRLLVGRMPLFSVLPYLNGSSRVRTKLTSTPVLPDGAVPQGEYGLLQIQADADFGRLDGVVNSFLHVSGGSLAALLPASVSAAGQFRHLQQSLQQQTEMLP
ncbi:MAG: hypothetical protein JWR07_3607 [Nevskia sp.]|nr:hypothetical protein [Nevskia sp.]